MMLNESLVHEKEYVNTWRGEDQFAVDLFTAEELAGGVLFDEGEGVSGGGKSRSSKTVKKYFGST